MKKYTAIFFTAIFFAAASVMSIGGCGKQGTKPVIEEITTTAKQTEEMNTGVTDRAAHNGGIS